MIQFLNKLFNIRNDEWPRILLLLLLLVLTSTAFMWSLPLVYAAILSQDGPGLSALPTLLVASAIMSIAAVAVYSAFIDRISNHTLLIFLYAFGTLSIVFGLVLLQLGQTNAAYIMLYLLIITFFSMFSSHFVTYVNGLYDLQSAKRVLPVVLSGFRLGTIIGGLSLGFLTARLENQQIFGIWLLIYVFIVLLIIAMPYLLGEKKRQSSQLSQLQLITTSQQKKKKISYVDNIREGFNYTRQSTYLRWMAVGTLFLLILMSVLEYRSSEILTNNFNEKEFANLLALLSGAANIIVLPALSFGLSRLIARMGLGQASLIFPVGTFGVSLGIVIFGNPFFASAAYLNRDAFRALFQFPIAGLLYNAVPLRIKGRARAFVEGLVAPIGTMLGGLLLLLIPIINVGFFVSALLVSLAAAYLVSAWFIRKEYSQALIQLLEQEDFSSLLSQEASDLTVTDPATLRSLEQKLNESTSPEFTAFMAKLISDIGGDAAIPILDRVAREDAEARSTILDIIVASDIRSNTTQQLYTDFLEDPDPNVRQSALAGLEQSLGAQSRQYQELAQKMLSDPNIDVRIQVIPSLLQSKQKEHQQLAHEILESILQIGDTKERAEVLRVLSQIGGEEATRLIVDYLNSEEDQVRLQAATSIERIVSTSGVNGLSELVIENITPLHNDPIERVRQATLIVLGELKAHESHSVMVKALTDSSPRVRATSIDVMVKVGKAIIPAVHPQLDSPDSQLRKMASVTLGRINQREFGPLITSHITGNLLSIYKNHGYVASLKACSHFSSMAILRNAFEEQCELLTDEIFFLLSALHEHSAIEIISQSLESDDERVRANALEALESITTPQTAALIHPLLQKDLDRHKLMKISQDTWDMQHPTAGELLKRLWEDPNDPWLQAVATFALGEIGGSIWGNKKEEKKAKGRKKGRSDSRKKRRGGAGDLFGALMDDADEKEEKPRSRRKRRRANPLDLLADDSGVEEEEPKAKPDADDSSLETFVGTFTIDDLKQAANKKDDQTPCGSLFTVQEIETMLAQSLTNYDPDVQAAAEAANRILSGQNITDWAIKEENVLSTIEKIIFLREVPFFQGMTVDQLKILATVCEEEFFEEDTRIYQEGDPGGVLYVVVSGRVGLERAGVRKGSFARVGTVEAHSYFGEMNLFDGSPRDESALAIKDTLTLRLRREPLIALSRQYPELSLKLINVLSERLRESTAQIAKLTRSRPSELHKLFDKFD